MMNLVEQYVRKPIPPLVWHYTSLSGFEGILNSGAIWATEARHTTDPQEFIHALAVANTYLENRIPRDEHEEFALDRVKKSVKGAFDDGPLSNEKTEVFVASFSGSRDKESQWLSYAAGGTGVSIAFDLRHIRPPENLGSLVTFAPCVYDDGKDELIQAALEGNLKTIASLHRRTGSLQWVAERVAEWSCCHVKFEPTVFNRSLDQRIWKETLVAASEMNRDLLWLGSHMKRHEFASEDEWRLALPHTAGKPFTGMEVLYRGENSDIPYIAHNLFTAKLPISKVVLGPHCQEGLKVRHILESNGFKVPVVQSSLDGSQNLGFV